MSRVQTNNLAIIKIHGITVDPRRWQALIDGKPISLTSYEFRLLCLLAGNAGTILTRQQIMEHLHGLDHEATEHSVNVQVFALRKKLGDHGCLIQTVRGCGYGFQA
jgi:two-component system, OmpR family, alkaline phosphatase synthesis response regulator PhoP